MSSPPAAIKEVVASLALYLGHSKVKVSEWAYLIRLINQKAEFLGAIRSFKKDNTFNPRVHQHIKKFLDTYPSANKFASSS